MSSIRRHTLLGKRTMVPEQVSGASATVAFGNVNTITITPGTPPEGCIIIVGIDCVATISITSMPSGFSRVVPLIAPSRTKELFYKIATASESGSYTFNFSGNATGGMYKLTCYQNLELVNNALVVVHDHLGTGAGGPSATMPACDVPYDVHYPQLAYCLAVVSSGSSTLITITNGFAPGPASHAGSAKIWTKIYDNTVMLAEQPTIDTKGLNMSARIVTFLGKRI